MAASNWKRYNKYPEYLGDGTIDQDDDTFKCALFLSTSNADDNTNDVYAGLTNEHANANGYVTGGVTIVSPTWVELGGIVTFDSADPSFTAAGGSITARYAVIYDDTPTVPIADPLVARSLLDTTPADVTVTDGNTLTVEINANGILTISGGQT